MTAHGEEKSEVLSGGGFSFEVVQPENQRDKNKGYFDLRMTPGQQQTVQIKLVNPTNIETTVSVKLNGAKTNKNGVIEYGPSTIENDASLISPFENLVKGPDEVKIPANSETTLDLEITMPTEAYDGVITGGIELQNLSSDAEENQTGAVINKYAYLIGMVLSETDTEVKPDMALNKVYPELSNYRNSIFVNFSNTQAAIVDDMTIDAQISKKGSDEVLYDTKSASMRMAPNSMIDFPISMQGERMIAGDYTAKIVVTTEADRWEWTEEFKITDEDADKFNGEDLNLLQEQGVDWKLIAMIVGGVFLLVVIVFVLIRRFSSNGKKKKKGNKKQSKKKSGKN
ncbi:hypothetical protein A5888_003515 [Enterococcus sp. 9E7_DIV0242]|uniref:Uncharacterized protein n=2 Tax=Candidatus Enterococcus clewellii TaxID=1834193 RepID=A0A242JXA4_9ENTE|nr:hypothetical protein A5888_003945 [Enterococcus sp. 9E7_DIV0242]OTP10511.1 hypothetical protein A5888_003809 [Enterococcus sp. 9E7_DIV0242]